ncbi:MAG: hypothetical protein V4726_15905 [Verrucomicrobiota bacterium]
MATPDSPASEASTVPAAAPELYPDPPAPAGRFPLGRRRLKDIPLAIQRPLECHLRSLRRIPGKTAAEISSRLDLHPDDLDALAAIGGTA